MGTRADKGESCAVDDEDENNLIVHYHRHWDRLKYKEADGSFKLFNLGIGYTTTNLKFPYPQGEYPIDPPSLLVGFVCGIACVCVDDSDDFNKFFVPTANLPRSIPVNWPADKEDNYESEVDLEDSNYDSEVDLEAGNYEIEVDLEAGNCESEVYLEVDTEESNVDSEDDKESSEDSEYDPEESITDSEDDNVESYEDDIEESSEANNGECSDDSASE
ncbi:hypothetical protein ACET3Z_002387 [Daucus carota]